MLVLQRREKETIEVDGPCTIHVVSINGGKAKLGIEAKASTNVRRGELAEELRWKKWMANTDDEAEEIAVTVPSL